ncbi:MAG: adenylosuccinate lyase [Chloroflexi bacterium AL-W]|nr:adenylosuccinate lyase [Chloroflexi bacterium AL-N1]NOK67962.1 adenylosuccinate lyase [Chloroflexi bacterium AL-N10]NOK73302.1 adenylosuccinate lyase [Chloroflexi bacterium AL-N5]NOK83216.1 adenylosuccinate lyase [Chloroflexi bacterium AL-W]NOK87633.1 adenylosuccinate lyase [Chloroflexi bacterium AL-N15]
MTYSLTALSPLDGRYRNDIAELEAYFSEAALFRYRVRVEIEYLIMLTKVRGITFVPPLEASAIADLRSLYRQMGDDEIAAIAAWDRKVNHDVKAVEYWLREQLDQRTLSQWKEAIHFGLTSEDVNNLAYALLVREARDLALRPILNELLASLHNFALYEAETPMLARTHGQPATPTTLGKEIAVFAARLRRSVDTLFSIKLTGKLNGATGSLAAHQAALPDVDWLTFSRAFVRSLDLEPVLLTTQIEPHDTLAEVCDALKRTNTILIDLCQDVWHYISAGYLVQASKADEVGSSTMPHKINPIDFENGEGNLGIANALLEHFSRKLPVSRLQRDLSDSTVLRNIGVAFGHSLLAYRRIHKGLGKLGVDRERLLSDVQAHPEVLAEAIQTILRRESYPEPYEVMKTLTRGHTLTQERLNEFIDDLAVSDAVKAELRALTPEQYTGLATDLARTIRRRDIW